MSDAKRNQMIALVDTLQNGRATSEEEDDRIMAELQMLSPDPEISDYIYSKKHENLTAEEVVDKALAYRPILL